MSEHTDSLGYSNTNRPADSFSAAASESSGRSVIGPTLVVKGELTAEEDLLVRGRIEGRIDHNQTLTVHEEGTVVAVVKAKEVLVEGTVQGDLFGMQRIKVCETGKVIGNVCAPRVGVMEGATFKGMVDMDSDSAAIERRYQEELSQSKGKAGKEPAAKEPAAKEPAAKESAAKASSQDAETEESAAKARPATRGSGRKGAAKSAADSKDASAEPNAAADAASKDTPDEAGA